MPYVTANKYLYNANFVPNNIEVKISVVMQLAFPAVKNEIIINHETPFFWNLFARGIIPQVHKGIKAPIAPDNKMDIKLFDRRTFSKKLSGIISARMAEISNANKKAGIKVDE